VRDWQKFIRERRSGVLRPLSREEKPVKTVGERQIRYDLKFLMAVLNFATDGEGRSRRAVADAQSVSVGAGCRFRKGRAGPSMLADERYEKMLAVAREVHRLCEPFFILVHETGHRAASVRQLR